MDGCVCLCVCMGCVCECLSGCLACVPVRNNRWCVVATNQAHRLQVILLDTEFYRDRLPRAKVGSFDESVVVDARSSPTVRLALRLLYEKADTEDSLVVPYSQNDYEGLPRDSVVRCGLTGMKICPYAMRHGGASHDALAKRRTLSEIAKRGHWLSDRSVRRYEKAGLLLQQWKRVPQRVQALAPGAEAAARLALEAAF